MTALKVATLNLARARADLEQRLDGALHELELLSVAIGESPDWIMEALLRAVPPAPARRGGVRMATRADFAAGAAAVRKEKLVRSKAHRMAVAKFSCISCGIVGHSQAAHQNHLKGKSLKVDDRLTFPLCSVEGNGCHAAFDEYRLFPTRQEHVRHGRLWTQMTISLLHELGTWVPGLDIPDGYHA